MPARETATVIGRPRGSSPVLNVRSVDIFLAEAWRCRCGREVCAGGPWLPVMILLDTITSAVRGTP